MNIPAITIAAALVFAAANLGALAQTAPQSQPADDLTLCTGVPGMAQPERIAPCTRVIEDAHAGKAKLGAALIQRCNLLSSNGEFAAAHRDCDRAVALMPNSAEAYSTRASLYEFTSNYDKAIADITMAIKFDPRPQFDYFVRGRYLNERAEYERFFPDKQSQRAKDYDRAVADLTKVVTLKPRPGADGNAQNVLEVLQSWARAEIDKAKKGKEETVRLGAADPRSWCRNENPPSDGPPFDRIILGCTAVIASPAMTKADKGDAYFRRADAERGEGRGMGLMAFNGLWHQSIPDTGNGFSNNIALADYRKAIAFNAQVAQSHYSLGVILLAEGNFREANAEMTKAITLNGPDPAHYYQMRGQTEFYLGQSAEAIADMNRSVQLKPDDLYALMDRSAVRDGMGDYDGALEVCNRAASLAQGLFPEELFSNDACGDIYFHKGDYQNAIARFDRAIGAASGSQTAESLYGRGAAKIRTGDKEGGQADIDAAVKQVADIATSEQKKKISP